VPLGVGLFLVVALGGGVKLFVLLDEDAAFVAPLLVCHDFLDGYHRSRE